MNRSVYASSNNRHTVDGELFEDFATWDAVHSTLSAGTGTFERTGIDLTTSAGGGDWTGNMRVAVDFTNRTFQSSVWGTFAGHANTAGSGLSGSFVSNDSGAFASGNAACTRPGLCSINRAPSVQQTCTGTSGSCSANNHGQVSVSAPASFS